MITLHEVFEEFEKIKIVGSTNEKQKILKNLLVKCPQTLKIFDIVYGQKNFNISTRSVEKIVGLTKKDFVYDDGGDLIEFYLNDYNNSYMFDWEELNVFFYDCLRMSGNSLLDYVKNKVLSLHKTNAKWIIRILLKNLTFGISLVSINKVLKSLNMKTIDKFEVQLAGKVDAIEEWKIFPILAGIKYDGFRAIIEKVGSCIKITSRQGKKVDFVPEVVEELKKYDFDFVVDGEIMAKDFNCIQKRIGRKIDNIEPVEDLHYRVFDLLSLDNEDFTKKNQLDRITELKENFKESSLLRFENFIIANDKNTLLNFYKYAISCKEEGIMLKNIDSSYVYGSRDNWFKVKPIFENTFEVVGFEYGSGKYKNTIGALKIKSKDGRVTSRVGSGLNDDSRCLFLDKVNSNSLIGIFIEVRYNEISKSGDTYSLRHPRFLKIRDDIKEADIIEV